jgi:uncharacterized Fe-S cluster-containing MiaB family protein
MGLESSHQPTLSVMNKQMTIGDFSKACEQLIRQKILVRAFVLLKPPNTSEQESIDRALDSIRFAFDCGVSCVSVIPVRSGNGWLNKQEQQGDFLPPKLSSLDVVLCEALSWQRGRVFADLWDADRFADTKEAASHQIKRLMELNHTQQCMDKR